MAFSSSFEYTSDSIKRKFNTGAYSTSDAMTIIIDPGHGGIDPGAVVDSVLEKELNLIIANKLYSFLSVSGYRAVLTRSDDNLLGEGDGAVRNKKVADLQARTKLVEEAENCIFVSIHMNKFSSSSAWGLQTFYSSNNLKSSLLAECIQNSCMNLEPCNKRVAKLDNENIYILKNTTKPAVLIECGFLSNSKDKLKLTDDNYQNLLAFSIYKGIIDYLGECEK